MDNNVMNEVKHSWTWPCNLWSFRYGIQPSSHLLPLKMKSVDFDEKSLRFASRMWSIGKHPCPPACGGQREKNRGFCTLITTLEFRYRKRAAVLKTVARKGDIYKLFTTRPPWKPLILLAFSKSSVSPLAPNQYNPNLVFPVGDGFGLFVFFGRFGETHFRNGVIKRPESKPRGPRTKKQV